MTLIEESLVQYGVLGLWTATLLFEKYTSHTRMMSIMREVRDLLKMKNRGT